MKWLHLFGHLMLILFLTALTQIGGLIYLLALVCFKGVKRRWLFLVCMYALSTFVIVPTLSPAFGRERIQESSNVKVHSLFTVLCNRNYVTPKLQESLKSMGEKMSEKHPGSKIVCLDANFPFWNGFPLLPHLSHNDGRKLDISLMYTEANGRATNLKPSRLGYGVFEGPKSKEYHQTEVCKENGYWQYDFPKYLTFGRPNKDLKFDLKATSNLMDIIVNEANVSKVFIEPHLRDRMRLRNLKIRFHGCQAVRHDDHIHIQVHP